MDKIDSIDYMSDETPVRVHSNNYSDEDSDSVNSDNGEGAYDVGLNSNLPQLMSQQDNDNDGVCYDMYEQVPKEGGKMDIDWTDSSSDEDEDGVVDSDDDDEDYDDSKSASDDTTESEEEEEELSNEDLLRYMKERQDIELYMKQYLKNDGSGDDSDDEEDEDDEEEDMNQFRSPESLHKYRVLCKERRAEREEIKRDLNKILHETKDESSQGHVLTDQNRHVSGDISKVSGVSGGNKTIVMSETTIDLSGGVTSGGSMSNVSDLSGRSGVTCGDIKTSASCGVSVTGVNEHFKIKTSPCKNEVLFMDIFDDNDTSAVEALEGEDGDSSDEEEWILISDDDEDNNDEDNDNDDDEEEDVGEGDGVEGDEEEEDEEGGVWFSRPYVYKFNDIDEDDGDVVREEVWKETYEVQDTGAQDKVSDKAPDRVSEYIEYKQEEYKEYKDDGEEDEEEEDDRRYIERWGKRTHEDTTPDMIRSARWVTSASPYADSESKHHDGGSGRREKGAWKRENEEKEEYYKKYSDEGKYEDDNDNNGDSEEEEDGDNDGGDDDMWLHGVGAWRYSGEYEDMQEEASGCYKYDEVDDRDEFEAVIETRSGIISSNYPIIGRKLLAFALEDICKTTMEYGPHVERGGERRGFSGAYGGQGLIVSFPGLQMNADY